MHQLRVLNRQYLRICCVCALLAFEQLFFCFNCYSQSAITHFPKVPLIQNFNSEDYNGGVQNWDITQDARGILYVANNYGVLEFDGTNWNIHYTLTGSRILSLFIDKDNTIYIGGQNQMGFMKSNPQGEMEFHSLENLIPVNERSLADVWKVYRQDNQIVFNTSKYTYFYDGEKVTSIEMDVNGRNIFQVGSNLLAYNPREGLFIWKGSDFQLVKNGHLFLDQPVIEILPNFEGGYMIFLSNGKIKTYQNGEFLDWKNEMSGFFQKSLINTALILKDNNIAIGTQNHGLVVLRPNGELVLELSKKKGINSNTVYKIYQDQSSNLWLGLSNGVSFVDYSSPFSLIDERLGLPGTGYTASVHQGNLYLGTNNGLFSTAQNPGNYTEDGIYYHIVPNSAGQVYSINNYGDQLLMGHHNGAYVIDNGEANILYSEEGCWKFAYLPNSQQMLAGTYEGFVKISNNLNLAKPVPGFNESSRSFQFENDSSLWMCHGFKGVFHLKFNKDFTEIIKKDFYGQEKGFPSQYLINVFRINDKLVFPAERGVYTYNASNDLFEPYEKLNKPLGTSKYINTLASNHLGDIYYIKQNKFGLLKRNNFGEYEADEKAFNPINKFMLSDDSENINIIDHKNILIGAKEGFIHYNPTIKKSTIDEFSTLIRQIDISADTVYRLYSGGIVDTLLTKTLTPDLKSIRFRFSAPYFDGFTDTEYQYFLEGFDSDWSEWSSRNIKEYTNLGYGNYTFHARAKNIYGDLSIPCEYSFQISRPWYLTKLAYAGYFILIIILFSMAMLWLDNKHKYDKKKMVVNQQRAIHQKDLQLETVAKESEARITQLRNEKLRADVEFKNKELAASTMHLLNKNEVMLDIKSKLEAITKGAGPKPDEVKKIVKSIERNISEDRDWEQFTIHFDQVHGDFLKKLKAQYPELTPQETKLAAYLRMNLTSKDVAQLLNISVRGVEISRYRLRKKLKIERETNLVTFLMDV